MRIILDYGGDSKRSGLQLESDRQEPPCFQDMRLQPSHEMRDGDKAMLQRTGLLLHGQQFSFQIKVNYAFHFEIKVLGQNPSCMRTRGCFQSQGAMSRAGVSLLQFIRYQEMLASAD